MVLVNGLQNRQYIADVPVATVDRSRIVPVDLVFGLCDPIFFECIDQKSTVFPEWFIVLDPVERLLATHKNERGFFPMPQFGVEISAQSVE